MIIRKLITAMSLTCLGELKTKFYYQPGILFLWSNGCARCHFACEKNPVSVQGNPI